MLYSFQGAVASDGATPSGNLINVKGTLYGTTSDGGASGYGTVFKVTTAGAETVLYPFQGSVASDGAFPFGALLNVGGTLYGTTGGAGQAAMERCSPSRRNKHASRQCGALWDNRSIPAYAGGAFRTRPTEEI